LLVVDLDAVGSGDRVRGISGQQPSGTRRHRRHCERHAAGNAEPSQYGERSETDALKEPTTIE